MEILIFLIWFCLVWFIPVTFIFAAYIAFLNGRKLQIVLPLLGVAMTVFIVFSLMLIGPMFEGFFAGSDPQLGGHPGNRWKYLALVVGYAGFGWLMCSVLLGRLIVPGRRLVDPPGQVK